MRLDQEDIYPKYLPHDHPVRLITYASVLEANKEVVSFHIVEDEDCRGHMPGDPVFPFKEMLELAAQALCLQALYFREGGSEGTFVRLVKVGESTINKEVRPEETLRAVVKNLEVGRARGSGDVDLFNGSGELVGSFVGIRGLFISKDRQDRRTRG